MIFDYDKIFIVINQGNMHWGLAVVYIRTRQIHFFDSMGTGGMTYMNNIKRWLCDVHQDELMRPMEGKWTLHPCDTRYVPQQRNSKLSTDHAAVCLRIISASCGDYNWCRSFLTNCYNIFFPAFDCGVFGLTFADFLSLNYPTCFQQEHIPAMRKRILLAILKKELPISPMANEWAGCLANGVVNELAGRL